MNLGLRKLRSFYNWSRHYYSIISEAFYYHSFFRTAQQNARHEKGAIHIHAGIGYMYLTYLEILLYHLLRSAGFKVSYSVYGYDIPIVETTTINITLKYGNIHAFIKKGIILKSHVILKAANVNYNIISPDKSIRYIVSEIESMEEILQFEHENIKYGPVIWRTLHRYYRSVSFDKTQLDIAKKYLISSMSSLHNFKTIISTQKDLKYVLLSHGIYATWEPIVQYCENNNIKYISYDRGKRLGRVHFSVNHPSARWNFDKGWERIEALPLTQKEHDLALRYLREREHQRNDVYAYNISEKSKNTDFLRGKYDIQESVSILTIFTNLIWDAASVSRDLAFKDTLDCICSTIDMYGGNKDLFILIRPHPAELVVGTNERYQDLVSKKYHGNLPSNVKFIPYSVNSFDIMEGTDIAVVNTSTVGIELAVLGIPVLLLSKTHYRKKGFTHDVVSKEEYYQKINSFLIDPNNLEVNRDLALKYFYTMMFKFQHEMPVSHNANGTFKKYTYKNYKELQSSQAERINQIITRISDDPKLTDFILS